MIVNCCKCFCRKGESLREALLITSVLCINDQVLIQSYLSSYLIVVASVIGEYRDFLMILMRLIIDCARGAPLQEVLFIITSALRSNDPGSYSVLKCSTNFLFVCKKFYVSSVFSELNSPVVWSPILPSLIS